MKSEILAVGTELLIGATLNTHAGYLSGELGKLGIDVYFHGTVGDNAARLSQALSDALARSELIFITGGLGPTEDDITLEAVSRLLGLKLKPHKTVTAAIRAYLKARGMKHRVDILRQTLIPENARALPNPVGTAPGVWIEVPWAGQKRFVCLLPGPRRELIPIFQKSVIPLLRRMTGEPRSVLLTRSLRFPERREVDISQRVSRFLLQKPPVTVGIYAKPGEVELKIMAKAPSRNRALKALDSTEKQILSKLDKHLVCLRDTETLEAFICERLKRNRRTLTVAESCTAGLLAHSLTRVPSSSQFFVGGILAYQDDVKINLLNVKSEVLKTQGAVSAACARQMAQGARKRFHADWGVSITGISGPGGGSASKPVGLTYIGISSVNRTRVFCKKYFGNRDENRFRAVNSALYLLWNELAQSRP